MITPSGSNLAYVLGLPRSGTTMLCAMLANHPAILAPPEPWVMLGLHAFGKTSHRHPADSHAIGTATSEFLGAQGQVQAVRAFALTAYNQKLAESSRDFFIDKTPRYYLILPWLRSIFPDAKWISLRRNPFAVAASFKSTWGFDLPRLLTTPQDNWAYYDLVLGLNRIVCFEEQANGAVYTVQYEALAADAERVLGGVLEYLNLPASENLTRFDLKNSGMENAYAGDKKILQTRSPHTQSLDAWESAFTPAELQTLLDAIGAPNLRRLGYEDVLEKLLARGIEDRGPDVNQWWLTTAETALARRVEDVERSAAGWATTARPTDDRPSDSGLRGDSSLERLAQERVVERAAAEALPRVRFELSQVEENRAWLRGQVEELTASYHRLAADAQSYADTAQQLRRDRVALDESLRPFDTDAAGAAEAFKRRDEKTSQLQSELAIATSQLASAQAKVAWYEQPIYKRWWKIGSHYARHLLIGWPHGRRRRSDRPLPRITIVTPAFNSQETIRHTIESVLGQGYPNLEYIISDGGSTDGTMKIVEEYRSRLARIISGPDGGMYDAIAKGFAHATGEVLGYLNSDDLYEPGGLLRAGEFFRDHPHVQVVYHEDTVTLEGWRFPNNVQPPFVDRESLLKGHILFQDGVLFRRSAYVAAGGVNRQMRRAGDWDLWVRLSGKFRFHRAPDHISSFRVRKGQISEDMSSYYAEIAAVRAQWRQKIGVVGRWLELPGHWSRRAANLLFRKRRRQFFYPLGTTGIGHGFGPSPGEGPPPIVDQPRCPLTDRFPDRLLFSSRDTRFGDDRIHYVYHCQKSHLAVTYPPMTREQLNVLYEKFYSKPPTEVVPPADGFVSPYRNYFGGGRLDRLIKKAVLPIFACKSVRWDDTTLDELLANTASIPRRGGDVSMLDLGCFEGNFLDIVAKATDWKTFGLEPNSHAVATARAKGHHVYQGYAEDAIFVIPEDHRFDIIFMGQTIEHVDDPLTVVRRLHGLLKQDGLLVMSTPNLDAKQIELFGPTWSHWHLPYHRTLFSERSLQMMGELAGFELVSARTYSHPYWTCLSVQLNKLGVGAAVSHAIPFGQEIVRPALSLTAWSKWLWDWRGRGDYLFAVFRHKL